MRRRTIVIIAISLLTIMLLLSGCYKRTVKQKAEDDKQEAAEAIATAADVASATGRAVTGTNVTACASPLAKINGECCLDENNNSACDKYEEACGNRICEADENSCTCPTDCGQCETQQAGACQQFTCENNLCVVKQAPFCCGDSTCIATESCGSCFQDCCSLNPAKDTLTNYEMTMQNWDIVVGDTAPPKDVAISTDILTSMQRYLIKRLQKNVTVGKGVLASEAMPTLKTRDHIVLGNPCDNAVAAELLKQDIARNYDPANETQQNCQIFVPGESMLRLVATSQNTVSLYIGGYSWRETEGAAQILVQQADSNNTRYNLAGREFRILGEKASPRIVAVQ